MSYVLVPLHVQVAAALGWDSLLPCLSAGPDDWHGRAEPEWWAGRCDYGNYGTCVCGDGSEVPRYDTDWSATGPLIERFKIFLSWCQPHDTFTEPHWSAITMDEVEGEGATPLIAACELIVKLHAAGKLIPPA